MNSIMQIQVRVQLAQAQRQLAALQSKLNAVQAASARASAASGAFGGSGLTARLTKFGNQLQWVGRQLTYNFTLPIALAGGFATKWALANEQAMVRVSKVYGDGTQSAQQMKNELNALGKAFVALSDKYGIAQADTINIAADWAAAGASGLALAKATDLTMKTMILGEMDATTATKALISIQAQYGLTVTQLSKKINLLNMVENQTGASFSDLIVSLTKSAGAARTAGVDVQHLAALTAALVPAAGSAQTAGNALKTILTRIAAPTKQAATAIAAMGIGVKSMAWQSSNGSDKLVQLAKGFKGLSDAQKQQAATMIAGRYQVNRFEILMEALNNQNSYYYKALRSSTSQTKNFLQAQKELNQVLNSSPQKLKIIGTTLQNSMAKIIQPLLPLIIMVANTIALMATKFAQLNPQVQKFVLLGLLLLAVIGPIAKYVGSTMLLFGTLGRAFIAAGRGLSIFLSVFRIIPIVFEGVVSALAAIGSAIVAAVTSPWIIAAAAVAGIIAVIIGKSKGGFSGFVSFLQRIGSEIMRPFSPLVGFFDKIVNGIISAFYALPNGIQSAFVSVVKVVQKAVLAVYHLFSYMNPFAHHSPSLVETVTGGVSVIKAQYGKLSAVGVPFKKAARDLSVFKKASAPDVGDGFSDSAKNVAKAFPSVLPLFNNLRVDLKGLNTLLAQQKVQVDAQQLVVNKWSNALDKANASLSKQQSELDRLQGRLDKLNNKYSTAQTAMQNYASTPIQGMQQYTDAIFSNQQAQNKLQLQIDKYKQANPNIENMASDMAKLAGQIENLNGQSVQLHGMGAGSEILNPINSQLDQARKQYSALQTASQNSPLTTMENQLSQLQSQGDILNLEQSIKFDPLTKQINDLANAQKALPFDEIIAGITKEQAVMAKLQPKIDSQTKAVNKQKAAVDEATRSRDGIQKVYDRENLKLQKLEDHYNNVDQAIQDITDSLNAMGSAASSAASAASKAAAGGLAGAGANFPAVGGKAKIGREGTSLDQSKAIEAFANKTLKQATDALGGFGDIFSPIKKAWRNTWSWIKKNLGPTATVISNGLVTAFSDSGDAISKAIKSKDSQAIINGFTSVFQTVWKDIKPVVKAIVAVAKLMWPPIQAFVSMLQDKFGKIWTKLGPTIIKFGKQILPMLKQIGIGLGFILAGFIAVAGFIVSVLARILTNVLGAALDFVIGIIDSLLNILGGVINFITSVFTGQWSKAWQDVIQIFKGLWNLLYTIVKAPFALIWAVVSGFVEGVVNFFKWLYDELVGHSIIPDLMHEIAGWFEWLLKPVKAAWNAIWTALKAIWNSVVKPLLKRFEDGIKAWADVFKWIWGHVIKPAWSAIWSGLKTVWNTTAKPLWDLMKLEIKGWAAVFKWIWDHVIKPAWNAIWSGLKAAWKSTAKPFWDGVEGAIKGIKAVFNDVKTSVLKVWDLLWSGLKTAWNKVGVSVFNTVARTIVGAVNIAIKAINALANGFNAITGLLHIKFKIGTMDLLKVPTFATGGSLPRSGVGAGFKTNGPRAIVGEGGPHPEYVIPTDPRYRKRAAALWKSAGKDIKLMATGGTLGHDPLNGGPAFAAGNVSIGQVNADISASSQWLTDQANSHKGFWGKVGGALGSVVDTLKNVGVKVAQSAAKGIFWPFKTAADKLLDTTGQEFITKMGKTVLNKVWDWISGKASEQDASAGAPNYGFGYNVDRFAPVALEMLQRLQGDNLTSNTKEISTVLRRLNQESGGNPNAINLWDSNAAAGHPSKGIMQVIDPTFQSYGGSFKSAGIWDPRANMYAGLNYAQHAYSSIADAMNQPGGYAFGGILPKFADGGIANRAVAGVFGESGKEVLAPLTPLWNKLDRLEGKAATPVHPVAQNTEIHFHGDLSFPSVRNEEDAEQFINNLKTLAGRK